MRKGKEYINPQDTPEISVAMNTPATFSPVFERAVAQLMHRKSKRNPGHLVFFV
jgi:hypothetical protein